MKNAIVHVCITIIIHNRIANVDILFACEFREIKRTLQISAMNQVVKRLDLPQLTLVYFAESKINPNGNC